MKHLKKGRKLGRESDQRKALLKGLAHNLISYESITTTEAKAKELQPFIEKMITKGRKQETSALRDLMKQLPKESAYKLYHEIAPRYTDRNGGYTRIIKEGKRRVYDGARQATIEFV